MAGTIYLLKNTNWMINKANTFKEISDFPGLYESIADGKYIDFQEFMRINWIFWF